MADETHNPQATDVGTLLWSIGSHLFLLAAAIRGTASDRGDPADSADGRVATELAGDLELAARRIDLVCANLCPVCRLLEVVECVVIERAKEPERPARRRKPD